MGLNRTVEPTETPISVDEAMLHCKVDDTASEAEIDTITDLIETAVEYIERRLGRSLMEQTWQLTLDRFSDTIALPRGPVIAVSSIAYDDLDGVEQVLGTEVYSVDTKSDRQWVVRNADQCWPERLCAINAVRINFTAGYAVLPPGIKHACKLIVGGYYDDRTGYVPGDAVHALIDRYGDFAF